MVLEDKFQFQNISEQFMVWDKSPNCIGTVLPYFFKQTEENSKQDRAVVTTLRFLEARQMIYLTYISNTKGIPLDYVENNT